jgi:hypothetical protein
VQSVDEVLRQAAADLEAIGARWAVIGGLAVAFRAEPRFTRDVDLAVAAASGADLEEATAAAALIEERGFNRGQSLSEDLAAIISQAQKK